MDNLFVDENNGLLEVFQVNSNRVHKISPNKDWRKMNAINPPIDQENCGACWAVSALTAIEARLALK